MISKRHEVLRGAEGSDGNECAQVCVYQFQQLCRFVAGCLGVCSLFHLDSGARITNLRSKPKYRMSIKEERTCGILQTYNSEFLHSNYEAQCNHSIFQKVKKEPRKEVKDETSSLFWKNLKIMMIVTKS